MPKRETTPELKRAIGEHLQKLAEGALGKRTDLVPYLAEKAKVGKETLNAIFRGARWPDEHTLTEILKYLHTQGLDPTITAEAVRNSAATSARRVTIAFASGEVMVDMTWLSGAVVSARRAERSNLPGASQRILNRILAQLRKREDFHAHQMPSVYHALGDALLQLAGSDNAELAQQAFDNARQGYFALMVKSHLQLGIAHQRYIHFAKRKKPHDLKITQNREKAQLCFAACLGYKDVDPKTFADILKEYGEWLPCSLILSEEECQAEQTRVFSQAVVSYTDALDRGDDRDKAHCLTNAGVSLRKLGKPSPALCQYGEALSLRVKTDEIWEVAYLLKLAALAHRAAGGQELAAFCAEKSIEAYERFEDDLAKRNLKLPKNERANFDDAIHVRDWIMRSQDADAIKGQERAKQMVWDTLLDLERVTQGAFLDLYG